MNLKNLAKPMDYKWRVQSFSKNKASASCVAYVDARQVQDRLDEVCGSENWQNDYYVVGELLFCKIGIKIGDEWVWKGDTGSESNIEKEKGHVSDAFKRAAVHWSIGRFLYEMEIKHVTANEKKTQNNYPYVVDNSGKRVWNLTEHIGNINKSPKPKQRSDPKSSTTSPANTSQSTPTAQAKRLIKLMDDDKTAKNLQKHYQDNAQLIASFPENLKKQIYACYWIRKKALEKQKVLPVPTPDPMNETSAPQNETEEPPPEEGSDNLPPAFGEGPEFMSDNEKHKIAADELMTSLSNTKPEDLEEIIANLKKGYLDKFPKEIKDKILVHCDGLLERLEKEEKKSKPGQVTDLKKYMDGCTDRDAGFAQIQKEYFKDLCKEDRVELIAHYKKGS